MCSSRARPARASSAWRTASIRRARARLAHVLGDLGEDAQADAAEARRRGDRAGSAEAERRARALFDEVLAVAEALQGDAPESAEGQWRIK